MRSAVPTVPAMTAATAVPTLNELAGVDMLGTVIQRSLGATDQTSRSVVASSELAGSMFRCLDTKTSKHGTGEFAGSDH